MKPLLYHTSRRTSRVGRVLGLLSKLALCATVALALAPSNLPAQFYDFDNGNDDGWTRYDPLGTPPSPLPPQAVYSFPDGAYRIQTPPSPLPGDLGPGRAGSVITEIMYTDFYVAVDFIDWNTNSDQAFGLLARVSDPGLGSLDAYAFTYDQLGADWDITYVSNEVPVMQIETESSGFELDPAKDYRIAFIGKGFDFEGRIYELPDLDTPVFRLPAHDPGGNYSVGWVGLVTYDNSDNSDNSTDATFDNFLAQVTESPRMHMVLTTIPEIEITWPQDAGPFRLQSTLNLPPTWVDVDPGLVSDQPPNKIYREGKDEATPQQKFFRLIQD